MLVSFLSENPLPSPSKLAASIVLVGDIEDVENAEVIGMVPLVEDSNDNDDFFG